MKVLIKLRLTQTKGTLRNLFSKPSTAIITLLVFLLYGSLLVPVVMRAGEPPVSGPAAQSMVLYILAFGLLMIVTTLIQKKRSLFFLSDAHYLFTGPFSQKKVLGVYAFDMLSSGLLYGLISLFPIILGSMSGSVPPLFILAAFLSLSAAHYGVLGIIGILYVRELSGAKIRQGSLWVLLVLALCAVAIGGSVFVQNGLTLQNGISALAQSDALNYLPFYGWARMAMLGVLEHNLTLFAIGAGLLIGVSALITAILVSQKGDFVEQSMMDAEMFTEYYQKTRRGETTSEGKVHKADVRFRKGEGAIYSKNLLIAMKGRELLRFQDFLVIAIYLLMAYFMHMGYLTFVAMLMFWMFMMAGTSSLVDDLQHHYVYLIPGSNLKKLLSTILVPLIKQVVVMLIALIGGGLIMGADAYGIVTACLIGLSILLVFTAGNVLSIRVMKSRSNKMVEQALRLLMAVIALIPGLVLFILCNIFLGNMAQFFAAPIFSVFNILLSLLLLLICAPMMRGNEINAD